MDGRPTWTDCDEAGDYVVPNVLSPRDLVSRPDIMDEIVPHIKNNDFQVSIINCDYCRCVANLDTSVFINSLGGLKRF